MLTGIRGKLMAIIVGLMVIVLGTHTYLQMRLQQSAFDQELQKRTMLMQENLHHRALSLAETLKNLMAEYIAAYKFFELNNTARQTALETRELVKIVVIDQHDQVYVDTSQPEFSGKYRPDPGIPASEKNDDYAKFTSSGLEGRSATEAKTDLSLNNVENTALSTWAGTSNIATVGTVGTGTWNGTAVADS